MNEISARGAGQALYGVGALLSFGLITLCTLVLLALAPGEQRRRRIVRRSASLVFRSAGARPSVTGLDHLPASPCVVVANHASYLDGMILTAVLPPRFSFVIKREMTRVPLAHYLLRRIGSLFVDRSGERQRTADMRRILNEAARSRSLVFFPEGTFTERPGLRPFQSGAFAVAARGGLPVVPIAIHGSRTILPADRILPIPGRIAVEVLPAIPAATGEALQARRAARRAILAAIDEPELSD